MTPRTERGAIEKMYRVRQYLLAPRPSLQTLTLEQHLAFMRAHELLIRRLEDTDTYAHLLREY